MTREARSTSSFAKDVNIEDLQFLARASRRSNVGSGRWYVEDVCLRGIDIPVLSIQGLDEDFFVVAGLRPFQGGDDDAEGDDEEDAWSDEDEGKECFLYLISFLEESGFVQAVSLEPAEEDMLSSAEKVVFYFHYLKAW